jgi:hypothetical protein
VYKATIENNIDPDEATKLIIAYFKQLEAEGDTLYSKLTKGMISDFEKCNTKIKSEKTLPTYDDIPKFNLDPQIFIPISNRYKELLNNKIKDKVDPRAKELVKWISKSFYNYTECEASNIPIVYPQDLKISEARDAMIKQLLSAPPPFSLKEVLEKVARGEDLGAPIFAATEETTDQTAAVEVSSNLKSAAAAAVPEYASSPPQKILSPYPESAEVTPSDGRSPQDVDELDESTTVPQNQAQEWNNIPWEE